MRLCWRAGFVSLRATGARATEETMQIVQTDEIPLKRGLEHRGGTFHGRIMLEGEPHALDNFQLSFGQMGGDFNSPRHRHNFEQIRYQLEGVLDYGRDGKLVAGMVGYFPEAVHYGPQSQDPNVACKTIVLQFGGASGSGYLSQGEVQAGMRELAALGEFKDGVFRRRAEVEGKRNLDAYQAIWEHVNGRPMVYPKPRYPQPIFIDPASYQWVPVAGAPGVAEKLLGVFTERRSEAGLLRLAAGARCEGRGRGRLCRHPRRGHGRRPAAAGAHRGPSRRRRARGLLGARGDRAPAFRPARSRRPSRAARRSGTGRSGGVGRRVTAGLDPIDADSEAVIAGLDPAIHPIFVRTFLRRRWMRGSSPRMTGWREPMTA